MGSNQLFLKTSDLTINGGSTLLSEQREEVVEIVTSWERKGMEKGFEIGIQQGIEIGMEQSIAALQSVVLDVLLSRFGILDASITSRVRALNSLEGLRNLTHKALTAGSLRELEF